MTNKELQVPGSVPIRMQVRLIARILNEVHPLSLEVQRMLAGLLEELSDALGETTVSADRLAHLTESTAHLVEAVHAQQEGHVVQGLRDRLERALLQAEEHYPNLAGLGHKLLDTLANLGI